MSGNFERRVTAIYLKNFIGCTARTSIEALALDSWLESNAEFLDIEYIRPDRDSCSERPTRWELRRRRKITLEEWHQIEDVVQDLFDTFKTARPACRDRNLAMTARHFGLDDIETGILDIVLRYCNGEALESFFDSFFRCHALSAIEIMARLLGVKRMQVERRLLADSRLQKYGFLVSEVARNSNLDMAYRPSHRLLRALSLPARTFADIQRNIVSAPAKSDLHWTDYDHIASERDYVCRLLKGAIARRARGINILLYGGPGTGKTEFAKVLAGHIGADLYGVGEVGDQGREPSRDERLADVLLCQRLLSEQKKTIILFDEMDDLISGDPVSRTFGIGASAGEKGSKVFLNRLLENNRVPAIWITNSVRYFDPAVLRRMTMAIEIRVPSVAVRERVWRRTLERERFDLPENEVRRLAREFDSPPGLAVTAVRGARLAGAGIEQIRLSVRSAAKAMAGGRERPPEAQALAAYNPALINPDVDLIAVARRLAHSNAPRNVSFCLYGPPGTGKSAFARYLADRLGMEVLHKRASDLISMWVGGTETNIADAFAEARASHAVLIFDEADSLLRDRGGAQRSWEVTQVNEMLTWMEVHDLPFVCTTNLEEGLDRASLRRFTFKVSCDYLAAAQGRAAFRHFFGLEPPRRLSELAMLTPGDFAVVKRKAAIMGVDHDSDALLAMLARECAAKPGYRCPIGFRARFDAETR